MSLTEIDTYEDPILLLARDPELNKEKEKTKQLIHIIHNFPLTERKVSKLCQLSLTLLQSLEKIELNLKNWAFLSLDINSADHFNSNNNSEIKDFNNNISLKVLTDCSEFNKKLNRISIDLDYITKGSRTLSPLEYISDSGTLLTSLALRNIKLKDELSDKITIAYSKAKLITIGTDLESMLSDDDDDSTAFTYKNFVVSLLKQLNSAIETEDFSSKYECLAVINDMEKMFDAFKLDRIQQVALYKQEHEENEEEEEEDFIDVGRDITPSQTHLAPATTSKHSPSSDNDISEDYDEDYGYESDFVSTSMYSSIQSHNRPLIHSITKSPNLQQSQLSSTGRRDSVSSLSTSAFLQKTSLSDELPYLMSAFNSAKNFEEDVSHYKEEETNKTHKKAKGKNHDHSEPLSEQKEEKSKEKQFRRPKVMLPEESLYSQSTILSKPPLSDASSYLYANNSLLSKLGIRPQVITTELSSKELSSNTSTNIKHSTHKTPKLYIQDTRNDGKDKENRELVNPLTKANLESHIISGLAIEKTFSDAVE